MLFVVVDLFCFEHLFLLVLIIYHFTDVKRWKEKFLELLFYLWILIKFFIVQKERDISFVYVLVSLDFNRPFHLGYEFILRSKVHEKCLLTVWFISVEKQIDFYFFFIFEFKFEFIKIIKMFNFSDFDIKLTNTISWTDINYLFF